MKHFLGVFVCLMANFVAADNAQRPIAAVEAMPRLPEPLAVRDWNAVARAYYGRIFDPQATGDSFPVVKLDTPGFAMKSYVGAKFDREAMTCLAAVIGAKLSGLDPKNLHGADFVARSKAWFDAKHGFYRHRPGEASPVVHADIYGYWPMIMGLMLAAQNPDDPELHAQSLSTVRAFQSIAHGMGCPEKPNFDVLGWNFEKAVAQGRSEPMNRLGHAPSVAWPLLIGAKLTGDADMERCARAAMNWYAEHPGRYELSHVMGPLTAARLNAEYPQNAPLDMDKILAAWFGDGDKERHTWRVTRGTKFNGLTCDGLDGARWGNDGFYAFTMGSLQNVAWLLPVARYDQRYARAIGRFALHAANSARLLQGVDLDANHQDHAPWKSQWDKENLLFYEGLKSWSWTPQRELRPYATGDPVQLGWNTGRGKIEAQDYLAQRAAWFGETAHNISLYMGNHVGFLGGVMQLTQVSGLLRWDCTKTDWFGAPSLPTTLLYNPFAAAKTVSLGHKSTASFYDLASGSMILKSAKPGTEITLAPDTAMVLVEIKPGAKLTRRDGHLLADGIVVDFRAENVAR